MTQPRLLFVLPAKGASGGANSVVQEAMGLARFGLAVAIAVNHDNVGKFTANYPELQPRGVAVLPYADPRALGALLGQADVVCATTNGSVREIAEARKTLAKGAGPKVAYYVQDYEPLFYAPNSEDWTGAHQSYTLIPGATLFAKTRWLCDIVTRNHGVPVEKVEPSIDHDIYFPDVGRWASETVSVVAMLRPQTPRRAPRRTARILETLADRFGDRMTFQVFGADASVLAAHGIALSGRIANHGVLRRTEVPHLLRAADLMLDLSDYQAFGRTALEGMACGCVPVVPLFGGTAEFARHGANSYVVDTRSDDAVLEAVEHFLSLTPAARQALRLSALETASRYSVDRAALSELALFLRIARQP